MDRHRTAQVIVAVAAATAVTACAAVLGLGELPHLAEGGADASSDVRDGASNQGPDGDVTSEPFCSPTRQATFCSDFDRSSILGPWNGKKEETGTLALSSDHAISAPSSLLVTLPAATEGGGVAHLQKNFTQSFSTFHCTLQYRRDAMGGNVLRIFDLAVLTPGDDYSVILYASDTGGYLRREIHPAVGGRMADEAEIGLSAFGGVWERIDITSDGSVVRIAVNGMPSAQLPVGVSPTATSATLLLGGVGTEGPTSGPWILRFDDVACTLGP